MNAKYWHSWQHSNRAVTSSELVIDVMALVADVGASAQVAPTQFGENNNSFGGWEFLAQKAAAAPASKMPFIIPEEEVATLIAPVTSSNSTADGELAMTIASPIPVDIEQNVGAILPIIPFSSSEESNGEKSAVKNASSNDASMDDVILPQQQPEQAVTADDDVRYSAADNKPKIVALEEVSEKPTAEVDTTKVDFKVDTTEADLNAETTEAETTSGADFEADTTELTSISEEDAFEDAVEDPLMGTLEEGADASAPKLVTLPFGDVVETIPATKEELEIEFEEFAKAIATINSADGEESPMAEMGALGTAMELMSPPQALTRDYKPVAEMTDEEMQKELLGSAVTIHKNKYHRDNTAIHLSAYSTNPLFFRTFEKYDPMYYEDENRIIPEMLPWHSDAMLLTGVGDVALPRRLLPWKDDILDAWTNEKNKRAVPMDGRYTQSKFDVANAKTRFAYFFRVLEAATRRFWKLKRPKDDDKYYGFDLAKDVPFVGQRAVFQQARMRHAEERYATDKILSLMLNTVNIYTDKPSTIYSRAGAQSWVNNWAITTAKENQAQAKEDDEDTSDIDEFLKAYFGEEYVEQQKASRNKK